MARLQKNVWRPFISPWDLADVFETIKFMALTIRADIQIRQLENINKYTKISSSICDQKDIDINFTVSNQATKSKKVNRIYFYFKREAFLFCWHGYFFNEGKPLTITLLNWGLIIYVLLMWGFLSRKIRGILVFYCFFYILRNLSLVSSIKKAGHLSLKNTFYWG